MCQEIKTFISISNLSNIDVRIQQAELEYQLGREELNLLTLLEESRTLQICIEESNKMASESHTLYRSVNSTMLTWIMEQNLFLCRFSCVQDNESILLQAIEVEYDSKNPKFGAAQRDSMAGLYIDWALEHTQLRKDDRWVLFYLNFIKKCKGNVVSYLFLFLIRAYIFLSLWLASFYNVSALVFALPFKHQCLLRCIIRVTNQYDFSFIFIRTSEC